MQKDMIKVMSVFGTRPEAIKMAPLVKVLEQTEGIESIVCVTAQHREMLDQVLEIFDLHPKYDLNIMQSRQTLAGITTRALTGLEEVMAEVLKDRVFYETSGGGMTVSGGEPLAHFDYLFHLLSLARKEKIHTCVETSGYASFEHIRALIPLVSLWLWDFKASEADHRRLTGVEAERIRGNLRKLDACGAPLVLRCPWIPEINDSSAYSEELLEISAELKSVRRIEIEPYQPLGEDKYKRLGRPLLCEAKFPSKKASGDYLKFLQNRTNIPVVEG